ncbi:MAG: hypothetical protein SFV54_04530 [Bryobacteraceae bacterium]|nr:hypothetical protein [Bryobacteraceae bacterium]
MAPAPFPVADLALSRRLERAEAAANARFVDARGQRSPASGACHKEVRGAMLCYDGPRSPCTQTFCLGLFEMPSAGDMDEVEGFFEQRGAPVMHEVSPLADPCLLGLLGERRYFPIEFSSMMYMPLPPSLPGGGARNPSLTVRLAGRGEEELWARTAAEGWSGLTGFDDLLFDLCQVTAYREGALSFLAEWEGRAIASGALLLHEGVALMAGASTLPEWRKRGAQNALFEARIQHAIAAGCDIAMINCQPGSSSQRNAERQGFRIAYTRVKWQLIRR